MFGLPALPAAEAPARPARGPRVGNHQSPIGGPLPPFDAAVERQVFVQHFRFSFETIHERNDRSPVTATAVPSENRSAAAQDLRQDYLGGAAENGQVTWAKREQPPK